MAPTDSASGRSTHEQIRISCVHEYNELLNQAADKEQLTDKTIDESWKFILGGLLSVGIGSGLLNFFGKTFGVDFITLLSSKPTELKLAILITFFLAAFNVYSWWDGPRRDLSTLLKWLQTYEQYRAEETERWLILLQVFAVVLLCLSTLASPTIFGIIGFVVYTANYLGFWKIHKKVRAAVNQAVEICDKRAPVEIQPFLARAYACIKEYWETEPPGEHGLHNRHQLRHAFLAVAFFVVTCLGIIGDGWIPQVLQLGGLRRMTQIQKAGFSVAAYALGIAILLAAIVSIRVMRNAREIRLNKIEADWAKEARKNLPRLG